MLSLNTCTARRHAADLVLAADADDLDLEVVIGEAAHRGRHRADRPRHPGHQQKAGGGAQQRDENQRDDDHHARRRVHFGALIGGFHAVGDVELEVVGQRLEDGVELLPRTEIELARASLVILARQRDHLRGVPEELGKMIVHLGRELPLLAGGDHRLIAFADFLDLLREGLHLVFGLRHLGVDGGDQVAQLADPILLECHAEPPKDLGARQPVVADVRRGFVDRAELLEGEQAEACSEQKNEPERTHHLRCESRCY